MTHLTKFKKALGFLTAAMVFAAVSTGCSETNNVQDSSETETTTTSETSTEAQTQTTTEEISAEPLSAKKTAISDLFSERDLDPSYTEVTAEIALNGGSASVSGSGAEADGSTVTITQEGVYIISGTLDDGQIIVNAPKEKVQLVLSNADITCKTSSPLYIIDCDKTFLTLADGTENSVTDGEAYTLAEGEDEPDAAVFSADSFTINGGGSLNVNGNYNDGIHSKDDIVITGGSITVNAVNNGIKGKDYVAVADGDITVISGGDGIKSTNIEDSTLGFVYIEGGSFDITADGDGIQAETVFTSLGGDYNIKAGGGSENASKSHFDDFGGGFGGGHGFDNDDGFGGFKGFDDDGEGFHGSDNDDAVPTDLAFVQLAETTSDDTTVSTKGVKAGTEINVSGGSFNIDSADDTLHSNGNITLSGGSLTLAAGDDGIHADSEVNFTGSTVDITTSYEGVEAAVINVADGEISLKATDDGFNAGDGTSQGGMGTYSSGVSLNISGGLVYVNADGDGLDSNGDLTISGGTVIVDGPTNSGNGALDSNGELNVDGGLLIAAGSSGMAEYPGSSSAQNSVSCTFDSTFDGGTLVTLLDESGKEIICFAPAKSFDNIILSSPDIAAGGTYTFYTGGSCGGEGANKYLSSGYNGDGTAAESFTVSDVTTLIGQQSMMGGGFGGGGHGGGFGGGRDGDSEPPTDSDGNFEKPDGDDFGGDRPE